MMPVDTDGLMDKCEQCGARAGVENADALGLTLRGRCSECPETGPEADCRSMAVIGWNKRQRLAKFAAECRRNSGG